TVINGGVDGNKAVWMLTRLENRVNANTKLVIFEPAHLDRSKASYVESTGRVFARLRALGLPTIFVGNSGIETNEEAAEMARKNGAYYYGLWGKGVPPLDRKYWQWDMGNEGGHMTAEGCQLWAKDMFPLVKQVLQEHHIK